VGDEELLPSWELVLKRSDGASVERVATGANGWPQHGMELRWGSSKAVCDRLKSMLDHPMVRAHTAGMHERNDGSVESVEHDGRQSATNTPSVTCARLVTQGISREARQTALQHGGIDDAHLVAVPPGALYIESSAPVQRLGAHAADAPGLQDARPYQSSD